MSSVDNSNLEILCDLILKDQEIEQNALKKFKRAGNIMKHINRITRKPTRTTTRTESPEEKEEKPEELEISEIDLKKVHVDAVKLSCFRAVATLYEWDKTKASNPKTKGGFDP